MKSFVSRFTGILMVFAAVGAHANQAVLNADQVLEIDGKKVFVICFGGARLKTSRLAPSRRRSRYGGAAARTLAPRGKAN